MEVIKYIINNKTIKLGLGLDIEKIQKCLGKPQKAWYIADDKLHEAIRNIDIEKEETYKYIKNVLDITFGFTEAHTNPPTKSSWLNPSFFNRVKAGNKYSKKYHKKYTKKQYKKTPSQKNSKSKKLQVKKTPQKQTKKYKKTINKINSL